MRDLNYEQWLDEVGVKWEYVEELDLASIDRKASLSNQARLEPLDETVVEQYAIDVKNGDVFPALLVRLRPQAAPILLGGNHRWHAFEKAGKTTHDAYTVWCNEDGLLPLMYGDNRRHGLRPTNDESCAQAVHLMERNDWAVEQAAATVGTTASRVVVYKATLSADSRATELGVRQFTSVPKSIRARLDAVTNDAVFAETASLVVAAAMNQETVFSLVTRLNETKTRKAALAILEREREIWRGHNRADTGTTKMPPTDRTRAMDAVTRLSRCRPGDVAKSCVDGSQAKLLGEVLLSGRRHLDDMLAELKKRFV